MTYSKYIGKLKISLDTLPSFEIGFLIRTKYKIGSFYFGKYVITLWYRG